MSRSEDPRFTRRGEHIELVFDGVPIAAIAGESIAAALTAAGVRTLGQDADGVPRGLFCGMGVCFECLVSVDGGTGERACLAKVRPRMQVRSIDYRAPGGAAPASGGAEIPPAPATRCDLLIVGAGPAGLAAADAAAGHGRSVVVLDERAEAGGQFFKQLATSHAFSAASPSDAQYAEGRALIERVHASGATLVQDASAWGAWRVAQEPDALHGPDGPDGPDGLGETHDESASGEAIEIAYMQAGRARVVRARQVVLASGAYERAVPFAGWTLPGVVTTGAAQGLLRSYRVPVGERVLVAGNGPLNLQVAYELMEAGARVVAVAEAAPDPLPLRAFAALRALWHDPALVCRGLAYRRRLRARGVPIVHRHHIVRAEGEARVERAVLAPIDAAGRPRAQGRRAFDVDAVCVGYGFLPSNELARLLGCELDAVAPGHLVPRRDADGRTSVPGLFVAGDGGAFGGARVALAEGRLAAQAALRALGIRVPEDRSARRSLARQRRFQGALWDLFAAPDVGIALAEADTLVCRCESVTLGRVMELVRHGARDLRALKCASRAGMGRCQGRYCASILSRVLARETGTMPDARALFAPQVPTRPVRIGAVAAEKPEWSGYRPVPVTLSATPPAAAPGAAPAGAPARADVVVVGAGIVGISAAWYLARGGIDVVLVDRGAPNGQASGGNAGSLHLQLLSFDFGAGGPNPDSPALRTLALQAEGIAAWLALEAELGADLGLAITGGIMVAEDDRDLAFLEAKTAAERSVGVEARVIGAAELRDLAPAVSARMAGAAFCPGEGKIDPLAATPAVLGAAVAAGARLMTHTGVAAIERREAGFTVLTDRGPIDCGRVVNAAGGWSSAIAAMVGLDLPVRSAPQQMIVTEPAEPLVSHLLAHAHRHLTMKQAANGNLIVGGGWFAGFDPRIGRPVNLREAIEGNLWAAERVVPAIAGLGVIRTWAAVGTSIDGAPILGEAPGCPGFYNAVGANGYTMGPVMGRATAELIARGRTDVDIAPFTLARF